MAENDGRRAARSITRCGGRPPRRFNCSPTPPASRPLGSSCVYRPHGGQTVHRARRSPPPSGASRRRVSAPTRCSTSRWASALDGEPLTDAEIEKLLAASNGLHLVRGRWVEVDRERLSRMLDEFRAVEAAAAKGGLSFGEAMRLVAGAHVPGDTVADSVSRLVERRRRTVAGQDARRPSRSGPAGATGPWRRAEGDVTTLSAGWRALAASAVQPRPGRVPRR